MQEINKNLQQILSEIQLAQKNSPFSQKVKLVAVSKFHPAEAVLQAVNAGQILFGENRIQEAAAKFDQIKNDHPELKISLHIIGSLQRNKVKEAVRIADCIQSVDRMELLAEIEKQCARINKKIQILFELHTGEESKAGFPDKESVRQALNSFCQGAFPHIEPKGFMTMAPNTTDEALIKKSFVTCRNTRDQLQKDFPQYDFSELSMGMSGDFKIAIQEGATMVRIGTAIFGSRA